LASTLNSNATEFIHHYTDESKDEERTSSTWPLRQAAVRDNWFIDAVRTMTPFL